MCTNDIEMFYYIVEFYNQYQYSKPSLKVNYGSLVNLKKIKINLSMLKLQVKKKGASRYYQNMLTKEI